MREESVHHTQQNQTELIMQRTILITGATSALGRALSLFYAKEGVTLILQGRQTQVLNELEKACQAQGAHVHTQVLDLCDPEGLKAWLQTLSSLTIDLAILNAGRNAHAKEADVLEAWDEVQALLQVNVNATLRIAHHLANQMQQRGHGQLVLISSLAAYFGLPVTPAYSASKAALKAYGESLRSTLSPKGVKVNVVMPGYIDSPMARAMPGPKPWMWTPKRAAQRIAHNLERNKARISFPFPLNWGCWWLAVLPASWSARIVRWAGYGQ